MLKKLSSIGLPLRALNNTNKFLFSAEKQKVVLFPGNGIGPEISESVKNIFSSLKIPIEFE